MKNNILLQKKSKTQKIKQLVYLIAVCFTISLNAQNTQKDEKSMKCDSEHFCRYDSDNWGYAAKDAMQVDYNNNNDGKLRGDSGSHGGGLIFGNKYSKEGITSNRESGGTGPNNGLNFITANKPRMVITNGGNVSIGTTKPETLSRLDSDHNGDTILRIEADEKNNDEFANPMIQFRQDRGFTGLNMGFSEEGFGSNMFGIGTRWGNKGSWDTFVINTYNGNIGIGTKNPQSTLSVSGKITAKEVEVTSLGWADFVFNDDYQLPTLEEVAQHINEKGHLIDIPSEKEVLQNGVNIGDMFKLQMQKIEELTLYIIQQEKRIQAIEKENATLKKTPTNRS